MMPRHGIDNRARAAAGAASQQAPVFGLDNRYGYNILEQIGSGSFGVVYLAERRKDKKEVAIKCVSLGMDDDARRELKALRNEVQILRACDDPFVVKYYESFMVSKTRTEETWIVMEFCDFGTLENLRKMEDGCIKDMRLIRIILAGVTLGLLYLHNKKMIHRDIKGGNVLLSCAGGCKLADFGVSAQMSNTTLGRTTMTGTPMFMAPEVIQQKPYTQAADVWSLGILLYEMLEGDLPFSHFKNPMTAMMRIPHMKAPRLPDPERYDSKINSFVKNCLQKRPDARMPTLRLAEHPLLRSFARELKKNNGVSPYLGNHLREKIKEMYKRRNKQRADSAARAAAGASTPSPPPDTGFSTSPSPPTPPPLPPESADTGTMFGPAEGSFEAIFSSEAAQDTFIEHQHGVTPAEMDTMAPQFSDTLKEIDSPRPDGVSVSAEGSFVSADHKYANGSAAGSFQKSSFKSAGSFQKNSLNGSSKSNGGGSLGAPVVPPNPLLPASASVSRLNSANSGSNNLFAKLKNPILVKGQSSVTKVATLLNNIPSNKVKIGDTECVVVYSERKKGFYTCDKGTDGHWLAGHRCRVRKDAQLIEVILDTA